MLTRLIDLTGKAWRYGLRILETPFFIPFVLWQALIKRVHIGELLNLIRYRKFFEDAQIKTILDVGANTGQFASAIRLFIPRANIYSFEPIPECYAKLIKAFPNNGRFKAFQVAIGNESGNISFWRSQFSESSSILPMTDVHKENFPWTAELNQIDVPIKTLDDYLTEIELDKKVLLKIDVQGYEMKALEGARQMLKSIDFILVETSFKPLYEGQASFNEIYLFLSENGFVFVGNIDQLISPLDGTILQADALFCREN